MRWLIVLAIIAIIAAFLYREPAPPPAPKPVPAQVTQNAEPEEQPEQQQNTQQAASPQQQQNVLARMQQVARQNNVQIVKYQPAGNGAIIRLQWTGNSVGPGGDFMNALISQGIIRNCNQPGPNDMGFGMDAQQRRIYWQQYQVTF